MKVKSLITPLVFTGIGALTMHMYHTQSSSNELTKVINHYDQEMAEVIPTAPREVIKWKTKTKTKTIVKKVIQPWSIKVSDGLYTWMEKCQFHGGVSVIKGDERKYVRIGCQDNVWFNWRRE